ncbi:MAG: adenosine kinase, partial [Alphaproteobacteria bacterium]|nr:adenosine kinase [Alphaproteobacteria bacterium]
MTADLLDVVGIGNAIVDVIAPADEALLVRHHLAKGSMTLVDAAAAERLYDAMGPAIEVSGGSAANSVVGVAGLGGHAGYIGKVRNDELGRVFAYDLRAAGVEYTTTPATTGEGTARCLINVTPDAQRTMCTFLG